MAAYLPVGPAGHGVTFAGLAVIDPPDLFSWRACPCGCDERIPPRSVAGYESHAEFYARLGYGPGELGEREASTWGPITPGTVSAGHPDPARRLTFYLGTHRPHWLTLSPVPLFISVNTLAKWQGRGDKWPTRAADTFGCGTWAGDSGGFTELRDHGGWRLDADEYGARWVRIIDEIGAPPVFVAPQDWMCEPVVITGGTFKGQRFVGTGLSVEIHQELTVANYVYLVENFPMVPWIPVLQGYTLQDYLRCVDMYRAAGVDLAALNLVGLGSVCRREATDEILEIVRALYDLGLRMHGFGCKTEGLPLYGHLLVSADSMAWSFGARPWSDKTPGIKLPECTHAGYCNNCIRYAMHWRENVLRSIRGERAAPVPGTSRARVEERKADQLALF